MATMPLLLMISVRGWRLSSDGGGEDGRPCGGASDGDSGDPDERRKCDVSEDDAAYSVADEDVANAAIDGNDGK